MAWSRGIKQKRDKKALYAAIGASIFAISRLFSKLGSNSRILSDSILGFSLKWCIRNMLLPIRPCNKSICSDSKTCFPHFCRIEAS